MSKLGKDNRLWRSPRHHLDSNDSDNYVHWVELFFDLIHVVMVCFYCYNASHLYGRSIK